MEMNQQSNLSEIGVGQLALQRAQLPATRALAGKTLSDHQRLSNELTALASQDGVTLPTVPNAEQQQLAPRCAPPHRRRSTAPMTPVRSSRIARPWLAPRRSWCRVATAVSSPTPRTTR
jgi:hypothetical protein